MKLRLIENYDVHYDCTRYIVERKERFSGWRIVNSFQNYEDARRVFERFKASGGAWFVRHVMREWPAVNGDGGTA